MCVTMWPANLSEAIGMGYRINGRHILGYQNTMQTLEGPNCMLLHVPTAVLGVGNLMATDTSPSILQDMARHVSRLPDPHARRSMTLRGVSQPVVVSYGAYELVLASSARLIEGALAAVSNAMRPRLNSDLLDWYDRQFPDYSFVLACFNNRERRADHPIMLWYEPFDPRHIFVPGLEAHDGTPPEIGSEVPRDFTVIAATSTMQGGEQVSYTENVSDLGAWVPSRVVGFRTKSMQDPNMDFRFPIEAVDQGVTGEDLYNEAARLAGVPLREPY